MAVYRNAAFFKRSIKGAKGFCNLLKLREIAKLNGIKDVPKWLKAVHRAFYEHVERHVWTTRYERLKTGEHLRLRIPNITPELIASFDWTRGCRGTTPVRYHRQSAARRSETRTSQHVLGTPAQAGASLCVAPKVCNCFNEINDNNALGFLLRIGVYERMRIIVRINGNFHITGGNPQPGSC